MNEEKSVCWIVLVGIFFFFERGKKREEKSSEQSDPSHFPIAGHLSHRPFVHTFSFPFEIYSPSFSALAHRHANPKEQEKFSETARQ